MTPKPLEWPICLDDLAGSDDVFAGLHLVAEKFVGGPDQGIAADYPAWLAELPPCVKELYGVLTRWPGVVCANSAGFGMQDFIRLPPAHRADGRLVLVQENQGGFEFSLTKTDAGWIGVHAEDGDMRKVSIRHYLMSVTLQEMVMGAPLWTIDEGMEGYWRRMEPDLTLLWSDRRHFFPRHDLQFYWHRAGAIVLCDDRGRGDIGCHRLELQDHFESFGFYNIC